jgi:hypothetical protein
MDYFMSHMTELSHHCKLMLPRVINFWDNIPK